MNNDDASQSGAPAPDAGQDLRQRAEVVFREKAAALPPSLAALTPGATRTLVHELQVHQIELEMQNEELRRAQHELDASRERYFDLYDLAPMGYCTVSDTGVILEANLTLATLLGVARGTLAKQPFSRFVLKEDADAFHLQCLKLLASLAADPAAKPSSCELRMVRSDGTHFWAQLATTVVPAPSSSPGPAAADQRFALRLGLSDISARKQAEAAQAKLQDQLTQAQKMETVGRLAGGMAHDFNNLLMGTMGFADLCRAALPSDHPVRGYLDEITQITQRSAALIQQLLAFARKQIIAPKVLDLNDALVGILNLLRSLIGANIHLVWRPGASLSPVKLDPSQLDQVLTNLCINARDAIAGGGTITIETARATLDQDYCADHAGAVPGDYNLLTVSDTGHGMTEDVLANIFEPFFTTKEVGKGTGLGLATVYGIVKQNGGYIAVSSEPGEGTTVRIYLPTFAAETVASTVIGKEAVPCGRGETILVVDDERFLREICGALLGALGYKVLAAASAAEALDLLARHPGEIHVLLTDLIMPKMDGRQLATRVRAVKPCVKVIFMSGYAPDVLVQRGVLDEGMPFLVKPFTRDVLARRVREVLDSR